MRELLFKGYTSNAFRVVLVSGFVLAGVVAATSSFVKKERDSTVKVQADNTCQGGFNDASTLNIKCVNLKDKLSGGWLNLTEVDNLSINSSSLKTIGALQNLSNVNGNLDLSGSGIEDVYGLKSLEQVEGVFNLNNNNIESFDGFKELYIIRNMTAQNNNLRNIDGLKTINSIDNLDLSSNKIRSLRGLRNLNGAKNLDLSDNYITRLDGLKGLKNVENLYINTNPFITDLSPLNEINVWGKAVIDNREYDKKMKESSDLCVNFSDKVYISESDKMPTELKSNFCEGGVES